MRTVSSTLAGSALAATTSHADAVDNVALLSLVSEAAGLVRTRWSGSTVDDIELTKLY